MNSYLDIEGHGLDMGELDTHLVQELWPESPGVQLSSVVFAKAGSGTTYPKPLELTFLLLLKEWQILSASLSLCGSTSSQRHTEGAESLSDE